MTQINGEYVNAKEVTKIVKKVLGKRYGASNVNVCKGRGTASSWVEARIEVEKPNDCYCEKGSVWCARCRETMRETAEQARDLVAIEMKDNNAKFSTYYGDEGNDPHDCFRLQVTIKKSV